MKEAAELLRGHLEKLPKDHPERRAIEEMVLKAENWPVRSSEQKGEIQTFTDKEKQALIKDGALIYSSTGETITAQRETQKRKGKPSFGYVVDAGDMLVGQKSMFSEVAIYPDPKRFFIPNSGDKSVEEQKKLAEKDAKDLRRRLGLPEITVVIPDEASTLTEVVFKHLDETGNWLFSHEYAQAHNLDYIYGRTKNPTNKSGSSVADVGDAAPVYGVNVRHWHRDGGDDNVWAVRLVVPKGNR